MFPMIQYETSCTVHNRHVQYLHNANSFTVEKLKNVVFAMSFSINIYIFRSLTSTRSNINCSSEVRQCKHNLHRSASLWTKCSQLEEL